MGPDIGGVDRAASSDRTGAGQGFNEPGPEPAAGPSIEAVVDRRGGAVFGWAVAPAAAGLEDVENAGDHTPIVDAPGPRPVLGKMRLDRRPLHVAQPEQPAHRRLQMPSEGSESDLPMPFNPLIGFGA